jgi:hypothetical protein
MAFAKFGVNSWGIGASVVAGVYFESDDEIGFAVHVSGEEAFVSAFNEELLLGPIIPPTPQWQQQARYDDYSDILQALAMGSPVAPTISTSVAGQVTAWRHVFDLADVIDGLGVTLAIDKVQYVEELTSAKIHGFTLQNGAGGIMRMGYKVVGSRATIISSINGAATVAAAYFPPLGNRVFKAQGVFRMNAQSAGALGVADIIKVEDWAFEFNRPQDIDYIQHGPQATPRDTTMSEYIDEPSDGEHPEIQLTLTYPRMNSVSANGLAAALRDQDVLKADMTFTGAFINSTDRYQQLYQWPHLRVERFRAVSVGARQVKPQVTFRALQALTSPTGMPVVRPFRMTRTQTRAVVAF